MPRKTPRLSALAARKNLLIAESELHRAQLLKEVEATIKWHRTVSAGARTVNSVASAAALIASGVRALRSKPNPDNGSPVSWLQPVIKGAGLVSSLFEVFRSRNGQKDKKQNTER